MLLVNLAFANFLLIILLLLICYVLSNYIIAEWQTEVMRWKEESYNYKVYHLCKKQVIGMAEKEEMVGGNQLCSCSSYLIKPQLMYIIRGSTGDKTCLPVN